MKTIKKLSLFLTLVSALPCVAQYTVQPFPKPVPEWTLSPVERFKSKVYRSLRNLRQKPAVKRAVSVIQNRSVQVTGAAVIVGAILIIGYSRLVNRNSSTEPTDLNPANNGPRGPGVDFPGSRGSVSFPQPSNDGSNTVLPRAGQLKKSLSGELGDIKESAVVGEDNDPAVTSPTERDALLANRLKVGETPQNPTDAQKTNGTVVGSMIVTGENNPTLGITMQQETLSPLSNLFQQPETNGNTSDGSDIDTVVSEGESDSDTEKFVDCIENGGQLPHVDTLTVEALQQFLKNHELTAQA